MIERVGCKVLKLGVRNIRHTVTPEFTTLKCQLLRLSVNVKNESFSYQSFSQESKSICT